MPHGCVERLDQQAAAKEIAVDVGQFGEVRIEGGRPAAFRRVQDLEEFSQAPAYIGAVLPSAVLDEVGEESARLEDARIVGEKAKDEPHEKPLEVGAIGGRLGEHVVERADKFRCLDVDRILVSERPALDAQHAWPATSAPPFSVRRPSCLLALRYWIRDEWLELNREWMRGSARETADPRSGVGLWSCRKALSERFTWRKSR